VNLKYVGGVALILCGVLLTSLSRWLSAYKLCVLFGFRFRLRFRFETSLICALS
jgi:hypothetical protein